MKPKHTPGPWTIDETDTDIFIFGPDNHTVASINKNYSLARTNAQLIAAAPELLQLLICAAERLIELGESESNDLLVPRIRSAIAKATGGAE